MVDSRAVEAAPVTVKPEDVDARRSSARQAILSAGLADTVRLCAPGPYGPARACLDLLEALEGALAAGTAVEEAMLARVRSDRARGFALADPSADEQAFAALLGVRVALDEALEATAHASDAVLPDHAFDREQVRALLEPGFAAALCRDLRGYLEHYRTHADEARRLGDGPRLLACARSHLRRALLTATGELADARNAPLLGALERAPLDVPGARYRGLERASAAAEEPTELLDVSLDDVVGNADVVAAGRKLARAIASFDLAQRRNPRTVENPVLFILGAPGCGKTVTAHALGRYFLELCHEAGVPARFRVIRRTDWASHYQNKSASDLLRIFRDEVFGFAGVAGCYWPDIDTAFAARTDPDIRAEEKANLATLFGILDGTVGPRNGKWFLVCDANGLQMDDAMVSRLTQDPMVARGPESAADYVRLLRDVKLRGFADRLPEASAWQRIGDRLARSGLSGRAVAAISGRIVAELEDVAEPTGFFRMTFDEKRAALRAGARSMTPERVLEHVDHYERFEKEATERAHHERFQRRVEEIRLQLSAQVAALGGDKEDHGRVDV